MNTTFTNAIKNNEFKLMYQPIVNISDEAPVALEALIRWNKPDFGTVAPDEFIPQAEKNGSIQELGLWVIDEVCRQLSSWKIAGLNLLPININVSIKQLETPSFSKTVNNIIKKYDIDPKLVIIEITETAEITNKKELLSNLTKLERIGHKFAIDDFGSGYSSIAYLIELPTDYIKIDGKFSKYIVSEKHSKKAASLINDLSRNSKFDVIAEGIEIKDEADKLKKLGAKFAQGFYYSRPLKPGVIETTYLMNKGAKKIG